MYKGINYTVEKMKFYFWKDESTNVNFDINLLVLVLLIKLKQHLDYVAIAAS